MAGKLLELAEAAQMIGVAPSELIEMRSRGEIFGNREGANWKFKLEEVQRVIAERGEQGDQSRPDSGILSADEDDFDSMLSGLSSKISPDQPVDDADSILVSEEVLGGSAAERGSNPSTIIGKRGTSSGDSDLTLAPEADSKIGSDSLLEAPGSKLELSLEGSDVLTGSDVKLNTGSGTGDMPRSAVQGEESALSLGDDLELGADDSLALESDIAIGSDKGSDRGSAIGSDKGSAIGSDVTLNASDSGINLAPSDSGLSLEDEPLDLGGSSVDSLELPEDDEVVSLDDEAFDPDQATQLKADDQFLLSPTDSLLDDESDSGSQVIALEDSESFDQDSATLLRSENLSEDAFVAAPSDALSAPGMDAGMGMGMAPQMAGGAPVYVQVPLVETPYSIWNVLSLMLVTLLLAMGGMLMVDIMLNMWMWDDGQARSLALMNVMLDAFGLNNP
jgi:hypothetical protein